MTEVARRSETLELLTRMEQAGALGPNYLDLSRRPDLDLGTFESLARFFGRLHDGSKWYIADLLLQAEARFGESAFQIAEATGRSERTLANWCWAASKMPRSRRRENLTFSHHVLVAPLAPAQQNHWLDRAEAECWSSRELQDAIKDQRALDAGSPGAMHTGDGCDEIMNEAVASIREQLIACNHSTGIVVEIKVVDGPIEYRVESRGEV